MWKLLLSLPLLLQVEHLPPLPNKVGLGGPIAGTHNDVLIVGGGANFPTPLLEGGAKVWHANLWVLHPGFKQWKEVQPLPKPLAYAACASSEHGIAVVGGSDENQVYADAFLIQWDVNTKQVQYQNLPPLPHPTAFGAAEVIGDQLFVIAGKTEKSDTTLSGEFWSLNLSNPSSGWKTLPTYPGAPRFKMATAVSTPTQNLNTEPFLYLISGSDANLHALTDVYRYQPSTQNWTQLASIPTAANASTALTWNGDSIFTFSGTTDSDLFRNNKIIPLEERKPFSPRIQLYGIANNTWSTYGDLSDGVATTRAVHWNHRMVLPSGETQPGIRTPSVQSLQPNSVSQATAFSTADKLVLLIYLAIMLGVGIYFARRNSSTEDFFLAGRKIPWWAAGISIFGTQLSAITFMAIPATAFGSDWRRFAGSLMAMPIFLIVIYFYLPLFRRLKITTAYEYLEQRFSLTIRLIASGLFILFQIGRMGIVLLLPAIALSAVTQMPTHTCIALMGILATVYTAMGGISAVIWTDVLQVFVLIGGAIACLIMAINGAGGVDAAWTTAIDANKLMIFEWSSDPTEMVAWVLIIGFFFTNLVPYTTDQTIIQRYLTTRDEKQAARGMWLNMAITIPTGLLFFGLGTALYAYYQANPAKLASLPAKEDQLVPWFVVQTLPDGIAGLVIAGIFAAAMSSLDSSINSVTTAVINDFILRLKPKSKHSATAAANNTATNTAATAASDSMRLARILTLVFGTIGTLAALLLASFEIKYLFDFFQKVIGLFGGALSGVFLLAVFCKRCDGVGALIGLLVGSTLTIAAAFFTSIHFLLYAAVGSLGCVAVGWTISLFRPQVPPSIAPNGFQNDSKGLDRAND
jgi:solute:Na+ symporter, SSS family